MQAILDKIIMYMLKRTYKILYNIWTHKLYSLKSIVNFLLVLVVTSYTERFKALKRDITQYLQLFETQYIFAHYYESSDKKLWQNSNLKYDFQGYTKPLNVSDLSFTVNFGRPFLATKHRKANDKEIALSPEVTFKWTAQLLLHVIKDVKELSWMSHRVSRFWFLLNFLFISTFFNILASLSISRVFSSGFSDRPKSSCLDIPSTIIKCDYIN